MLGGRDVTSIRPRLVMLLHRERKKGAKMQRVAGAYVIAFQCPSCLDSQLLLDAIDEINALSFCKYRVISS